jgi:hypothetical protein
MTIEVLKPGALYADFSAVRMRPSAQPAEQTPPKDEGKEARGKGNKRAKRMNLGSYRVVMRWEGNRWRGKRGRVSKQL